MILLILVVIAFSTRLLPLSISSYPFNNDGITESRIAEDILASEHLSYPESSYYIDTHSIIFPVYNILLAFCSALCDVSPYSISHYLVAVFSAVTILAGYAIALRISSSVTGAVSAAMVLSLFGTFVYLSGSAWKESLGVAMLLLLTYAFMNRNDKRYLILELMILAMLPLVHHLLTVIAYLMLVYLTCWSVLHASVKRSFGKPNLIDIAILVIVSTSAYVYYAGNSFQRLAEYGSLDSLILLLLAFIALFLLMAFTLSRMKRSRLTLAPVVASVLAFFVAMDYSGSIFPYASGYSSNVIFLGLMFCVIVGMAWYGFEKIVRSDNRYKAIPLGLLLPVLTLLSFAALSGFSLESHKVFYRTYDFADIALALGVSIAIVSLSNKKTRVVMITALMCLLVCTFPFAYLTGQLVGVRHDTQQYEVDGLAWIDIHVGSSLSIRTDERLSYCARALYDYNKDPYLPSMLAAEEMSNPRFINLLIEEWMEVGVNDYPRGYIVLSDEYVHRVLSQSNVIYCGGPESNSLVVFRTSSIPSLWIP